MSYNPALIVKNSVVGGVLAMLLLSGCASVQNIDADKGAVGTTKRIALLGIHEPRNVAIVNIGGAAGAFGLIGGLIQGDANASHSKDFVAKLKQQKVSLSEPLLEVVTQALKNDGYEVTVVRDQKPKLAADGKSDDYSNVHVDADAILSVWFGVAGYMSSPYSTHYEPWVAVNARLLDAKTKRDIYRKTFCIGYKAKVENAVFLPADPKYRYKSFDDIMANFSDATAGLIDCGQIAATQIAQDLKVR